MTLTRTMKPLILQIQDPGPNPQKVAIVIEELGLPYEIKHLKPDSGPKTQSDSIRGGGGYNTTVGNGHDIHDGNGDPSSNTGGAPPVQDKNTGMIILTDPNTNMTLWESLALIEYLVEEYDVDYRVSYPYSPSHSRSATTDCGVGGGNAATAPANGERDRDANQYFWQTRQWLAYQMGAQSPFYSLKAWFSNHHGQQNHGQQADILLREDDFRELGNRPSHCCGIGYRNPYSDRHPDGHGGEYTHLNVSETTNGNRYSRDHGIQSVIDRFADDVRRIVGIMEYYLKTNGTGYLVGSKCTVADLEFVSWNNKLAEVMGENEAVELTRNAPHFKAWHERLMGRPAVQSVMRNKELNVVADWI